MSALNLTPEQHLAKACEALDCVKNGMATEPATSLSAFATAHLMAAQVKLKLGEDPYGDPRPWHGAS